MSQDSTIEDGRTFSKDELKSFVIKLRKQHRKIQEEQIFCHQHNFDMETEFKRKQADIVQNIIFEMESEFDLGFVWDKSLD